MAIETLAQKAREIEEDPLSAACEATQDLKILLDAIRAVREREIGNLRSDSVTHLSGLAEDQCDLIEGCLEQMLKEITEGRMPGRPGAPGQYQQSTAPGGKEG